jgi:hypothetical protein
MIVGGMAVDEPFSRTVRPAVLQEEQVLKALGKDEKLHASVNPGPAQPDHSHGACA